ncbi:MAG: N-acetylmuramoyl-L-alanine amidase [Spirochaetaceae bacterium]|jgi:N-acetylmuramoyl-L-alanine amidase|nr:N-acetylmuramoyl-L-alanine amidase [Spirochaetaceae bacterium]
MRKGAKGRGAAPALAALVCALALAGSVYGDPEPDTASASGLLSLNEVLASLEPLRQARDGPAVFQWDPLFRSGAFVVSDHYAAFQVGDAGETGVMLIDRRNVLYPPAPFLEKGRLRFPEPFASALRRGLERAISGESLFRIAAVIVDPGHGGKDTGAVGTHVINGKSVTLVEKDITLAIGKDLHERLARGFPDKRILLTRTADTYPSLSERVDLANSVSLKENEAVVFVSVHANASFNRMVRGYEVWYLKPEYERNVIDPSKYAGSEELIAIHEAMVQDEFITESILMAKSILRQFERTLEDALPSRGIKAEEWFVVRNTRMPAVLVELGFLTNAQDAALFLDRSGLRKFSEALYKGISDFIADFEQTGGYTAIE